MIMDLVLVYFLVNLINFVFGILVVFLVNVIVNIFNDL